MSRRGRFNFGSRGNNRREFYQHDDRNENTGGRGGFNRRYDSNWSDSGTYEYGKQRRGFKKRGAYYKKSWNEDVQMSEGKPRYQQFYENQRRGHRGRQKFSRYRDRIPTSHNIRATSGWNKLIVKNGSQYDQEEVITCIKNHIEDDITTHLCGIVENDLQFYIEGNEKLARSIMNLSGRMRLNNGQSLKIYCYDSSPPSDIKLTPPQLNIVEKVMGDRYSAEMGRIDLKNFHNDMNLVSQRIFCPLYRLTNLKSVMEIILKNIPRVKEIDLSHNQLANVIGLEALLKCPNLEILSLEKNKLRNESFSRLSGLAITELNLEGNPLCDKFKDPNAYTSSIRKFFPNVVRLDGVELPKPISFGLDVATVRLPPSLPSFLPSEVKGLIFKFIEEYYRVFESNNRGALVDAYTKDARFSFVIPFPEAPNSRDSFPPMEYNRNLLRGEVHSGKRKKQLFSGHKAIADELCKFPQSLNFDPNSFVIDIPFIQVETQQLMHVVLTGVFRLYSNSNYRIRSFMRSMVIVPVGDGLCISNEELFFCPATQEQIEKAFKTPTDKSAGPSTSSSVPNEVLNGLQPVQVEMLNQFALNSKMLPQFARECLEQSSWDYDKAVQIFVALQNENKIPPEYFGMTS